MLFKKFPAYICRCYAFLLNGIFIFVLSSCSNNAVKPNSAQVVHQQLVKTHPGLDVTSAHQDVIATTQKLMVSPLTPQAALQLMLLNSPRIESSFARLGATDAAFVQAGLIGNPRFSLALLKPENGGSWLWDLGLTQSLADLFNRNMRIQQAGFDLGIAQLDVSHALHNAIDELQQFYFAAIAAQQQLAIQQNILAAVTAKQALAESLYKAGNISELAYLEHFSQMQQQERIVALQQKEFANSLSTLGYFLGLGNEIFTLPNSLPLIPEENFDPNILIATAAENRIDIQLLKEQQKNIEAQIAVVKKEYHTADSSIGVLAQREADGFRNNGVQADISIPVFDNGQVKIRGLHAQLSALSAELKDVQLRNIRDIRHAIANLDAAKKQYKLLQDAISTAEQRVALAQREVNFMLSSPFHLLELKAQSIQLKNDQTSTLLAYWQARSQLELVLGRQINVVESSAMDTTSPHEDEHAHHHINTDTKTSGAHKHD